MFFSETHFVAGGGGEVDSLLIFIGKKNRKYNNVCVNKNGTIIEKYDRKCPTRENWENKKKITEI